MIIETFLSDFRYGKLRMEKPNCYQIAARMSPLLLRLLMLSWHLTN